MALQQVEVTGLFGRFDYQIALKVPDNITIITAPNGYGKTVILNLITHFFRKQFAQIRKYDFSTLSFAFTNGKKVVVHNQRPADLFGEVKQQQRDATLLFEPIRFGTDAQSWSFQFADEELLRRISVERYLPFVTRAGAALWTDDRTGRPYSATEILAMLPDSVNQQITKDTKMPPWLSSAISDTQCHLIETQRLLQLDDVTQHALYGRQQSFTTVVQKNAQHLSKRIGDTLQSYANEAQKLDQSFPKRVLTNLTNAAPSEEAIRKGLTQLEEKRTKLVEVGLLDKSFGQQITTYDDLDDTNIRNILSVYIDDTSKKLSFFDDMYRKIDVFKKVINEHFFFKTLTIGASKGMAISGDRGEVPLDALSSGEQHELVLIYELLFKVSDKALILIDEPELSLHVAWQKRFISDLQEIQRLRPLTILIATHSPQIINNRLDLMVELSEQEARDADPA